MREGEELIFILEYYVCLQLMGPYNREGLYREKYMIVLYRYIFIAEQGFHSITT